MSLIVCKVCSTEHSVNAVNCPNCGHDRKSKPPKMKPCRICKTMLVANDYRFIHHTQSHYLVEGTSQVKDNYHAIHRTCPNCAEPFPLKSAMDNVFFRELAKLFLAVLSLLVTFIFSILSYKGAMSFSQKVFIDNFWLIILTICVGGFFVFLFSYRTMRKKVVGY